MYINKPQAQLFLVINWQVFLNCFPLSIPYLLLLIMHEKFCIQHQN